MLFTTLPVDCVLEILEKLGPFDIRNVKMVNERMKTIVDRFKLDKIIYEVGFSKESVYVKTTEDSEAMCSAMKDGMAENPEDWDRLREIVTPASAIENIFILDWKIDATNMTKLHLWFGFLGIRIEKPIKNLYFEDGHYKSFEYLSEFLDFCDYKNLRFADLNRERWLKDEFLTLRNLKSLEFADPTLFQICFDFGTKTLIRLRHSPIEKLDLQPFKTHFKSSAVVDLIKFAVDNNFTVDWNFGEIHELNHDQSKEIESLKDYNNSISVEVKGFGYKGTRKRYTINFAETTIKFNARKLKNNENCHCLN